MMLELFISIHKSGLPDRSIIKSISVSDQKPFIEIVDEIIDLTTDFHSKKNEFIKTIQSMIDLSKISKKLDKFYELQVDEFFKFIKKESSFKLS